MAHSVRNIDVFILCGGQGRRLRQVSRGVPKPMVSLCGQPFLDLIISSMARYGFCRFVLGLGYKAGAFKKYYSRNRNSNLKIKFSQEDTPLDTGGAIMHARRLIRSNPFFVLNGDSLSEFDPRELLKFHRLKKSLVTILLNKVPGACDYGRVKLNKYSQITSFNEKSAATKGNFINSGIYIFDKKVFKFMPGKGKFSLEYELFPLLAVKKSIFGYKNKGFFVDIGTPERYAKAKKDLRSLCSQ